MRRNPILLLFAMIAMSMVTVHCHSNKRVSKANLAYIYSEDPTVIHPFFKVYHLNDSATRIYVRFKGSEILYNKHYQDRQFNGKLSLHARIYRVDDDKKLVDSATAYFIDRGDPEAPTYLMGHLDLIVPFGDRYFAEVTLMDENRMQYTQDLVFVDKRGRNSGENFLIRNGLGNVHIEHTLAPGELVNISTNGKWSDQIHVRYYLGEFDLPTPPFSSDALPSIDYYPDSSFKLQPVNDTMLQVRFNRKGVYWLQPDTNIREGLAILVLADDFPHVRKVENLIPPLRYLTTRQEYENISEGGDAKSGVDKFWFSIAGNSERGKSIIKAYYNRILVANQYFTSYTEGWKTDRGLIYIVYGPPAVIYKTKNYENWVYGEKNSMMSIDFKFYKVDNPFSQNDYYLSRSSTYKNSWYRAIDGWRQGRIY